MEGRLKLPTPSVIRITSICFETGCGRMVEGQPVCLILNEKEDEPYFIIQLLSGLHLMVNIFCTE